MSLTKGKLSVSLDEDLVAELEADVQSISAQVNAAVRAQVEQRRRRRLLGELLDRLDTEHGPVDVNALPLLSSCQMRSRHFTP